MPILYLVDLDIDIEVQSSDDVVIHKRFVNGGNALLLLVRGLQLGQMGQQGP